MDITVPSEADVEFFWEEARKVAGITRLDVVVGQNTLAVLTPPTWAFGTTAERADAFVADVLAGERTATSGAAAQWEAAEEELPRPGTLSILCDGSGRPRALVRTVVVEVLPFEQVPVEHAAAEGEDSLESWRTTQRAELAGVLAGLGQAFTPAAPLVLERFTLVHPLPRRHARANDARVPH